MRQNENQTTVNVPVGLLKQHAWLRDSASWVARISDALGAKARREPDKGTAQDAQMRIRLYALNGIGEPLGLTNITDWTCPGFVDGYGLGFQALCCGNCLLS